MLVSQLLETFWPVPFYYGPVSDYDQAVCSPTAFDKLVEFIFVLHIKYKKEVLLVFDGVGHPIKQCTQVECREKRKYFQEELDKLYGYAQANKLESVAKNRKKIAFPSEDLIVIMLFKRCGEVGTFLYPSWRAFT